MFTQSVRLDSEACVECYELKADRVPMWENARNEHILAARKGDVSTLPEPEAPPEIDTQPQPSASARPSGVAAIEASLDIGEAARLPELESEPQPEPAPEPQSAAQAIAPQTQASVPWWPFAVYLAVWVGGLGAAGWLFWQASPEGIFYGSLHYAYMVFAGLVLTLMGPALAVLVWLVSWLSAERGRRAGLLSASLSRGALVTFIGVALWWGMLVLVDAARLGRPW
jgi:hypothetical protein